MTLKHPMFPPTAADPDLYVKVEGVTPENIFQAIGRLREEAQNEIDRLLTFLDNTDGYSTTELEPSLGSIEKHPSAPGFVPGVWRDGHGEQTNWSAGTNDDREDDHDGCEPDEDLEPSLGSLGGSHLRWSIGMDDEREHEHDGAEPDEDLELSLGGSNPTISGTQAAWASGCYADYEDEHDGREPDVDDERDDSGIGDMDGLLEQCSGYRDVSLARGNMRAE